MSHLWRLLLLIETVGLSYFVWILYRSEPGQNMALGAGIYGLGVIILMLNMVWDLYLSVIPYAVTGLGAWLLVASSAPVWGLGGWAQGAILLGAPFLMGLTGIGARAGER